MKRSYTLSFFISALALGGCGDDAVPSDDTDGTGTGDTTSADPTGSPTTMPPADTTMGPDDTTDDGPPGTDSSGGSDDPTTGVNPGEPAEFFVRIENISDEGILPTPVSPGIWVNHNPMPSQPIFDELAPAPNDGLEALAEDGDPSVIAPTLMAHPGFLQTGVFDTPTGAGAPAPIMPGEMYEFTFVADPGTRLSLAAMLGQSNDLLFATGDQGVGLFNAQNTPMGERDITASVALWDIGTEANQAPGQGPNQAPYAGPDVGPSEAGTVGAFASSTRAMPLWPALVSIEVDQGDGMKVPADEYTITITNVSDDVGTLVGPLSEFVWATHDDTVSLFGATATTGLEALAEEGSGTALALELGGMAGVDQVGTEPGIAPGESITITVTPSATEPMFSFATMVSNSNDAFLAQAPAGVPMLDAAGMPRDDEDIEADILATLGVWDAGTEANEVPGVGANQPLNGMFSGEDDADPMIRRYFDITNDLAGDSVGGFVSVTVVENAGDFTVTVTNTSDATAYPGVVAPTLFAVHDDTIGPFEVGMAASPGLELLAEDGDPSGLLGELTGSVDTVGVVDTGTIAGVPGPLLPGDSYEFTVTPAGADRFLSLVAMIVPSNDTFMAMSPAGVALLDAGGAPRAVEDIEADIAAMLTAWDAGTENNQAGAAGRDMAPFGAPNTGAPEGTGVVRDADDDPVWPVPASSNMIRVTVGPVR